MRFSIAVTAALVFLAGCSSGPDSDEEREREWEMEHLGGGEGKDNVVPVPKGLAPVAAAPGDDWTQYGHDAVRSWVSKEGLDLPFTEAWTWKPEAPAKFVANAVAAAGYVHVHCIADGNGQGMQSGFRNPWLVSLSALTGEYRGGWTPQKDVSQGNWMAVYEDFNVLFIDDGLGSYDCRTFTGKMWCALDRWGPLAVDHQLKIVEHVNNQMADADLPLIEAHKLSGSSLWRNNIWKIKKGEGTIPVHEVNITQGICYCAVRYTGPAAPKDGLYAFEAQKGAQVWLVEGQFRSLCSGAKRIYAVDDAGEVRALDLRTGKEQWKASFGAPVNAPGLWKDRLVALTTSGDLVAMGAEEKEDGKILWTHRVDGAITAPAQAGGVGGAPGLGRTVMVLAEAGRALICTKTGVAILDLNDGKEIGRWTAEGTAKEILKDGPVCPILSRGTLVLCGNAGIVALWTSSFLRDQSAVVLKQAEALGKSGKTAEAIRIAKAVSGAEG
ncbi:MAG: PQQ-like beta-propeller repeat protein, partial [Planctomycetes bacterium]|nr:PQQ-like beta-propeller repeat protein [Planctomycetota bacterium]